MYYYITYFYMIKCIYLFTFSGSFSVVKFKKYHLNTITIILYMPYFRIHVWKQWWLHSVMPFTNISIETLRQMIKRWNCVPISLYHRLSPYIYTLKIIGSSMNFHLHIFPYPILKIIRILRNSCTANFIYTYIAVSLKTFQVLELCRY